MEETKTAINLLAEVKIKLKPTFINFSPFISKDDLKLFDEFVSEMNLGDNIDPLQKETRLLLYKGSPLLDNELIKTLDLVEHETYFDWVHPDPDVDAEYEAIATPYSDGRRKKCCIKG
jgi:hopanoid C-3 methylase